MWSSLILGFDLVSMKYINADGIKRQRREAKKCVLIMMR